MWGAQCLLEVRRRFWVGSGRPSMLMLVRSAAALATMELAREPIELWVTHDSQIDEVESED